MNFLRRLPLLLALAFVSSFALAKEHDFAKWDKAIAAFQAGDEKTPPAKGGIVFVGSSTIVRWKTLAQDYPGLNLINRGFGGNEIEDCTHFAEQTIFPYEPKMVVLRAGGNDIHNGKSPEQVFSDFKAFVEKVRGKLPDAEILYLSMSPSIARLSEIEQNKAANALIKKYCEEGTKLKYIDTWDVPLGTDGQPDPAMFVEDKLHFSPAGYVKLAERVRPFMPKP
ncbi:MAG TPA: GDSL-type esterase/lipase family protein [Chthoniobacteraceae bacterium]|nr:GDSL-type esterase/lipase family protein [Chthoniobacteraceae bacterium]